MSQRKDYGEPWVDLTNTLGDTIDDRDGKFVAYGEGKLGDRDNMPKGSGFGRRIVACVNQCIGLDTDRLEKMVPGTLANLLGLKASRSQLTEARIAEIIDERMVKACYEPMGKEIAALIVAANLLTLKGEK